MMDSRMVVPKVVLMVVLTDVGSAEQMVVSLAYELVEQKVGDWADQTAAW